MLDLIDGKLAPQVTPTCEELSTIILSIFCDNGSELVSCSQMQDGVVIQFFVDFQSRVGADQGVGHFGELIFVGELKVGITTPAI